MANRRPLRDLACPLCFVALYWLVLAPLRVALTPPEALRFGIAAEPPRCATRRAQ